jgi:hypothetical protein
MPSRRLRLSDRPGVAVRDAVCHEGRVRGRHGV